MKKASFPCFPYAMHVTSSDVISWYCEHDKRKRPVHTHQGWTIISAIVKSADVASRTETRDRIARTVFPAFRLEFSDRACDLSTPWKRASRGSKRGNGRTGSFLRIFSSVKNRVHDALNDSNLDRIFQDVRRSFCLVSFLES